MQALRALTFSSKTSSSAAALLQYPYSKRVFTVISNSIHGSNIRSRGRSHAAVVSSDSSEPQRGRKRITRDERRANLKAFVDKYRDKNGGKFPTPSTVQKHLGGSYYVVKYTLQELEYNSKLSTTSSSVRSETPSDDNECKAEFSPSQEGKEVQSSTARTGSNYPTKSFKREDESQTIVSTTVDLDEATINTFEAKVETLGSIEIPHSEDTLNTKTTSGPSYSDVLLDSNEPKFDQEAGLESDKLENKDITHLSIEEPENSEKRTTTSDVSLDIYEQKLVVEVGQDVLESNKFEGKDVSTGEPEDGKKESATSHGSLDISEQNLAEKGRHGVSESDKSENKEVSRVQKVEPGSREEKPVSASDHLERDVSKKENEEQQSKNTSTLWGNLRSFADGIINLWRKM